MQLRSIFSTQHVFTVIPDVERQARPDPPASRRTQKHTKNINARDPQDPRRQEKLGLTFGRAEHFILSFLLDLTGAYPLSTIPDSIARPYWAPPHLPLTALLAPSAFDSLLSPTPFDSNPLSFLSSLSFLVI